MIQRRTTVVVIVSEANDLKPVVTRICEQSLDLDVNFILRCFLRQHDNLEMVSQMGNPELLYP